MWLVIQIARKERPPRRGLLWTMDVSVHVRTLRSRPRPGGQRTFDRYENSEISRRQDWQWGMIHGLASC